MTKSRTLQGYTLLLRDGGWLIYPPDGGSRRMSHNPPLPAFYTVTHRRTGKVTTYTGPLFNRHGREIERN